jgi:hypothetical protein
LTVLFSSQVLYAGEGESRKPDEGVTPAFDDSVGSTASLAGSASGARAATILAIKGHEFVQVCTSGLPDFSWYDTPK